MNTLARGPVDHGIVREENYRDAIVAHQKSKKGTLAVPKVGRCNGSMTAAGCNPGATLDLHARP